MFQNPKVYEFLSRIIVKASSRGQFLLRFSVPFAPFQGCERVHYLRMLLRDSMQLDYL